MRQGLDRNRTLIFKLLDIAVKNNELDDFMLMMPNYSISSTDPNRDSRDPLDHYSWEALYRFADKNPHIPLADHITKALMNNSSYKGEGAIMATISFLEYHCRLVKSSKDVPFVIEVQPVLDELRNTILSNKEMYTMEKDCFNEPFWNYIEAHSEYLKKEFDLTLI